MALKGIVGFVASLLTLVPILCFAPDSSDQTLCVGFAVIASTLWGRRHCAARHCFLAAGLALAAVPLADLIATNPVCHQAFQRGWLTRGALDEPIIGMLVRVWLEIEHVASDGAARLSITWISFGLCCGLASAQAFSGELENQRLHSGRYRRARHAHTGH
jgi:hypothetical protein